MTDNPAEPNNTPLKMCGDTIESIIVGLLVRYFVLRAREGVSPEDSRLTHLINELKQYLEIDRLHPDHRTTLINAEKRVLLYMRAHEEMFGVLKYMNMDAIEKKIYDLFRVS